MNFRSSNVIGFTHHGGDIVAGVDSSHGVLLSGGSTGGIVQAVGDDANVSLSFLPKGAGALVLGNSSNAVQVGGSTAPFVGFLRQVSSFATPNFATTNAMVIGSTVTMTGANSSWALIVTNINLSTDCAFVGASASTANEVRLNFVKVSTLTVAASTGRVHITAIRF